jgi:parvulin-like peptidyl-prolyl isomerase
MVRANLSCEQEVEAKILEAKIQKAIQTEIADLARLMASKPDAELFGNTEFQVRDLVLRVGAKVYEERLREKKTATKAPE